jgi:hypothetical protein
VNLSKEGRIRNNKDVAFIGMKKHIACASHMSLVGASYLMKRQYNIANALLA